MESNWEVLVIDPSTPLDRHTLAAKYRDLRLTALQLSPESFSSNLEEESKFSLDTWVSHLFHPHKKTILCIDKTSPSSSSADTESSAAPSEVTQGKWVAQVTIHGPIPAENYRLPAGSGQPAILDDSQEERWQLLGMYTLPSHRGKGLAKLLCNAVFEVLKAQQKTHGKAERLRLMVKSHNVGAVKLYGSLGFVDAGRCTLAEAVAANQETDRIPKEMLLGEKFNTRNGIIMECRI